MTREKDNKILAIDISDNTIEIVESGLVNGKLKIFSMNRAILEAGIVENGEIKNAEALKNEIKVLMSQAKPESMTLGQAVFSLPDNMIYSHLFEIEENTPFDLEKRADRVIPIDKSDRMLSTKKFTINNKNYYLVMAVSKRLVKTWQNFFRSININLKKIEFSPLASFYGIKQGEKTGIVCLTDIGANTTSVSFFNKDGLLYFYNLYKAGNSITKKIALNNKITSAKAELIKIKTDISKDKSAVAEIIKTDLNEIFNDLDKNIKYLQNLFSVPIEKIIVLGGVAKQTGMQEFLTNLKITVPVVLPDLLYINNDKLEYINTLGLSVLGNNIDLRAEKRISLANNKSQKSYRQKDFINKYKRPIILFLILITVIFLGIIFLNVNRAPKKEVDLISREYPYYFNLPLIIDFNPVQENVLGARTVKVKIEKPLDANKLFEQGKKFAEAELKTGEVLWEESINKKEGNNIVFPMYLEWLIYNQAKTISAVQDEAKQIMKETNYLFEEMKAQSLEKGDDSIGYRFYFLAKIHSVLSLEEIEAKKEKQAEKTIKNMIEVKDIGSNLNVRQGPGISFPVVGQALSKGLYEFIDEDNGWFQINLSKDISGWVLGDLVEKKDNFTK